MASRGSALDLGERLPTGGPVATSTDVPLSGRNRENRLVHLTGPATLVGQLVDVRVEHAGPYALRGNLGPMASEGLRLGPR